MKTRFLIVIGMIVLIISSITLTYLSRQMDVCSASPEFMHNPRMNGIFDCLNFMSTYDQNKPDLRPTLLYDIGIVDLVVLETMLIVGSGSSMIVFITWKRKRKPNTKHQKNFSMRE